MVWYLRKFSLKCMYQTLDPLMNPMQMFLKLLPVQLRIRFLFLTSKGSFKFAALAGNVINAMSTCGLRGDQPVVKW